jgi:hypothetical protein
MQPLSRYLAVIAVFSACGGHCQATTLPDASFKGLVVLPCPQVQYFGITEAGTVTGSVSCSETDHWSGSATVSGANNGTVSASLGGYGLGSAEASAVVQYSFALLGGQPGSKVPVTIETKGNETRSGGGVNAAVVFTISSADESYTVVYSPGFFFPSLDVVSTYDFVVGKQYAANLTVAVSALGTYDTGPVNGSFSAFLDPVYSPAAGSGVTIAFSPNLLPVPEPACWAMLIAGFTLVGATLHRRQRVA